MKTQVSYYTASLCAVLAACMLLLFRPTASDASTVSNTTVFKLSGENGAFFVYVNGTPSSDIPSCATETSSVHRYALNPNTASGAAQIALVLTAAATQASISIYGLGTCTYWGDTEDINYVQYQPGT